MAYFDELSDLDFEEVVADLFRAATGLPYRAGTRGRDAGIDVLAEDGDDRYVIQCKHYRDSTFSQLKAEAKKEATKLGEREDSFAEYRFATSRRLNHDQRSQLYSILKTWV